MATTETALAQPASSTADGRGRTAQLTLLGLCHLSVDSYATLLSPLLPVLVARMQLSLFAAGALGSVVSLANMTQPIMGLVVDRLRRRILVPLGALLTAVTIPMMGLAPSFAALVVLLALGGLGVAAFHPAAFALAGELGGERRSTGIAVFAFSGTIATGLTPLWAPAMAADTSLRTLPLVALVGVVTAVAVWARVPLEWPAPRRSWAEMRHTLSRVLFPLTGILAIVALRSVVAMGFAAFIPLLSNERGLSLLAGGALLSVYSTTGVVFSLVAGYLADRTRAAPLVWGSLLLAAPALYLSVSTAGVLSVIMLALGGGMVVASNAVLIAIAQRIAPGNEGLASSVPLGLGWGLGAIALPIIGAVADRQGIELALRALALLAVLPAVLSMVVLNRGAAQEGTGGHR